MQPTITAEQAKTRVADILAETHRQLPPGADLKPQGGVGMLPCDDPTDGGPAGRIFVEEAYQLEFSPNWPTDQAIPLLARYWEQQGHRVVKDFRDDDVNPELGVEYPDGFRVAVHIGHRTNGGTDIYLLASSPCVWEHGTPAPE